MSASAHRTHYTLDDYLSFEASSNVKHEYLDGKIYAMAGGSPEHAALAAAVIGLLFPQLRDGRCRAHDADLRVRVPATGLHTYPDVTVICGPREVDTRDAHAVNSPTLIVEVLSPSTQEYDRGEKFEHYERLPSLKQYVLVDASERTVEVRTRTESGWSRAGLRDGEVAKLESIGATLDVRELFDAAASPG
jgi:Uma2 family endonuclease